MQAMLNEKTQDVGNKEVQKWYKNCGVPAVFLTVCSLVFCNFVYQENTELKAQIVSERNAHTQDLRENTNFIQNLLKSNNK